jgi:hypothetical protein
MLSSAEKELSDLEIAGILQKLNVEAVIFDSFVQDSPGLRFDSFGSGEVWEEIFSTEENPSHGLTIIRKGLKSM